MDKMVMDTMVMDAIARGWTLGIGTRVRSVDADIEAARERGARERRRAEVLPIECWLPAFVLVSLGPTH